MKKLEQKNKLNNGGFSLVELIIVIAIMAVLIGVLAPQFIRYVEKSRYQKDVSMVDEVKNAIEVALSEEKVYDNLPATDTTITFSNSALTSVGWTELDTEVQKTIKLADTKLSSKTCTAAGTTVTIVITGGTGEVTMNVPAAP